MELHERGAGVAGVRWLREKARAPGLGLSAWGISKRGLEVEGLVVRSSVQQ